MKQKSHFFNLAVFLLFFTTNNVVKAQCSEVNNAGSMVFSINVAGQSFTTSATCGGLLQTISVETKSIPNGFADDAILSVYLGNGNTGNHLGSLSGVVLNANQYNPIDVSSLNIQVTPSTQYTFIIDRNNSGGGFVEYDGSSAYSGGDMFFETGIFAGFDIDFEVIVDNTLSVSSKKEEMLKIYPNPTTDYLRLKDFNYIGKTFELISLNGKVIRAKEHLEENMLIDVSSLSSGIYFIRFENGNLSKFIKN